jgi:hypothetical protein
MISSLSQPAIFSNIYLSPNELGLLDLQFYGSSQTCKYHVIQTNALTGDIVGGKAYKVDLFPSRGGSFNPGAEGDSLSVNRNNNMQWVQDSTKANSKLNLSKIESILPNPATHEITVTYKLNEVENAYIFISNYYFTGMYDNYVLDINSRSRTFNIQNYAIGFYIVTLVCDGKVADVKTFVKH